MERLWQIVIAQLGAFLFAGGTPASVLAGLVAGGSRLEVVLIGLLLNAVMLSLYVCFFAVGVETLKKFLPQRVAKMVMQKSVGVSRPHSRKGLVLVVATCAIVVAPPLVVAAIIAKSVFWKQVSYIAGFLVYRFLLVGVMALTGEGFLELAGSLPTVNLDIVLLIAVALVLRYQSRKYSRKAA